MKLVPGKLYFLTERDFLTGEISPYVKIGLVRNEKETLARIKEHKTGNPREIIDHCSLEAPMVEHLETNMHYLYADCWITGEWFRMKSERLEESIETARQLIKQQELAEDAIREAQELNEQQSDGTKEPTTEDQALYDTLLEKRSQQEILKAKLAIVDNKLRAAMSTYAGIEGIADLRISEGKEGFSGAALKKDHPELHETYSSSVTGKIGGSFLVKSLPRLKDLNLELSEELSNSKFTKPSFSEMLDTPLARTNELTKLHDEFISLQPERVKLKWEIAQLEAKLKCAVGTHEYLGELVQWTRKMKTSNVFDKEGFMNDHPELVAKYTVRSNDTYSVLLRPHREYAVE